MLQTNIPGFPVKRGKVRDIYEPDKDHLIIVTTDRISAYDYVLPSSIPDKGRLLTGLSLYWRDQLCDQDLPYHCVSTNLQDMPEPFQVPELEGRTMLVKKAEVIPFECVARGYLCGSSWKEYQKTGGICGIQLPVGLKENQQFPTPIFTPATKAESGHDENVTLEHMAEEIGSGLTSDLMEATLDLYSSAASLAWHKGIIIADTKFEFGVIDGVLTLIDEVLTPDSSRFWPLQLYQLGKTMPSFDKQFVRDWLESSGWDKNSPPPELPEDVIDITRHKYLEAYELLTGASEV